MEENIFLSGIYPISPMVYESDDIYLELIKKTLKTNIKVFQFRGKHLSLKRKRRLVRKISELCYKSNVKLIVNDDIDLLKLGFGCGLHIGEDKNLKQIRKYFGRKMLIGVSCYNSVEKAKWAESNGADYVSLGAFFPSKTKKNVAHCEPNLIHQAKKIINIPICAIGGIGKKNIKVLLKYKPDMIGIISGIFSQTDVESTTNSLINLMDVK